jgi:hypothetical protein
MKVKGEIILVGAEIEFEPDEWVISGDNGGYSVAKIEAQNSGLSRVVRSASGWSDYISVTVRRRIKSGAWSKHPIWLRHMRFDELPESVQDELQRVLARAVERLSEGLDPVEGTRIAAEDTDGPFVRVPPVEPGLDTRQ